MKRNRKVISLFVLLAALSLLLSRCISEAPRAKDPRGPAFAGSATCRNCHQQVYDAYVQTAHFKSTRPANAQTVMGNTAEGHNRFVFGHDTAVAVQQRDSGLFQVAYAGNKEMAAYHMDIVFGNRHAQTFLYWKDQKAFELPLSFYTSLNDWATSPGYSATQMNFNRFIGTNCFECHSSFIDHQLTASTAGIREVLKPATMIYGIDCERCHGPAANHVAYQQNGSDSKADPYIVRIHGLSRQQKLDVCAVCHSGNDKLEAMSTFRFHPGDTLANYFLVWPSNETPNATFDVHGNQYQLLSQSPCFLKSRTLDCGTCHNPHTNADGNLATFSAVCRNCHQDVRHDAAVLGTTATALNNDCVSCHMPKQASRAITYRTQGSTESSAYQLRTHKIGVYKKFD